MLPSWEGPAGPLLKEEPEPSALESPGVFVKNVHLWAAPRLGLDWPAGSLGGTLLAGSPGGTEVWGAQLSVLRSRHTP